MSNETNLAQRLAMASVDLRGWSTDKRNQEGRYDYISADAVLHRAGEALGRHGVLVLPSMTDHGYDIGTTAKGNPRFDAWVRFEFVITDGESSLNATWFGRGTDYGAVDKAVYKAITSGHKYFLMKLLNIGVGNEDGEHDEPQPQAKAQPKTQPAQAERPTGKTFADGEAVTVKALPFFNEYFDAWGELPDSAESLRQWIKDKRPTPATIDAPMEKLLDGLISDLDKANAGAFAT